MPVTDADVAAVLHKFDLLPARNQHKEVEVEFMMDSLYSVDVRQCDALNLPPGATMSSSIHLELADENPDDRSTSPSGSRTVYVTVYFPHGLAEEALALEKGTLVKVRARTAYGLEPDEWNPDAYKQDHKGLVVEAFLSVTPPPPS
jgi:hypothetical protein